MVIDELLKEATLVANAAVRMGKPTGPDLCKKIADAKAEASLTWDNPKLLPLQESLAAALSSLSPITLKDLRAGFSPYGPKSTATKIHIGLLAFLAFVLLYVAGALSFWQNSAAVLIASANDEKFVTRERLLGEALPILIKLEGITEASDDNANPNSVLRSTLRNQINEIILISQEILRDGRELDRLDQNFTLGCILARFSSFFCPGASAERHVDEDKKAQRPVPANAVPTVGVAAQATKPNQSDLTGDDPKKETGTSPGAQGEKGFQHVVNKETTLLWQARRALGVIALESTGPGVTVDLSKDLARRMTLFSVWLLPALYGALGSVVFHLRLLLDPTQPDPDAWRIFLRISLSAFAGISLAWFWRPDAGGNFSIASISVGSATMTFLIGYSIDSFFRLLDRIVFVANTQIEKMGGSDKQAVKSGG